MRLVDTLNTHNPALVVLSELGCSIDMIVSDDEEMGIWRAKIDGNEFEASDPLSLLGLVIIWKYRGENWRRSDDRNIYEQVINEAFPD